MKKQICTNCVLDTSFTNIKFNNEGICNYCIQYKNSIHQKFQKKNLDTLYKITDKIKKS